MLGLFHLSYCFYMEEKSAPKGFYVCMVYFQEQAEDRWNATSQLFGVGRGNTNKFEIAGFLGTDPSAISSHIGLPSFLRFQCCFFPCFFHTHCAGSFHRQHPPCFMLPDLINSGTSLYS